MSAPQRLLVVGGNGFLGSAVCRAAISRGWDVHSLSTSGRPPTMPTGETPAWTSKVTYHTGSALDPSTFSHLLPESTAVVHTLGILLEGDYKGAVRGEAGSSLLGTAARMVGVPGMGANPLEKRAGGGAGGRGGEGKGGYERVNRDSALSVLRALLASKSTSPSTAPAAPFVYISAEDIFRPFVPAGYIASKRQAEHGIEELVSSRTEGDRSVTSLMVRPGIMTHPTLRPFLSPLTPLLALSSALPPILPNIIRALSPRPRFGTESQLGSSGESMARMLQTRTMDVDDVGEAVCLGIERGVTGVVGVDGMRRLTEKGRV